MGRRKMKTVWHMWVSLSLLTGLLLLLLVEKPASATILPQGFEDQLVASVPAPTALAFTPDDRMLLGSQPGTLQVYDQDGTPLATPALGITGRTCSNSERGLLGVVADPGFTTNGYIYVYYTFNRSGTCVNRVSRFTLPESNMIDAASESVLVDNIPSPLGNHNAGDLHFDNNGYLYISVGDGGTGGALARELNSLNGKILRVKIDGSVPPDNPFASSGVPCKETGQAGPGQQCQEIFAWGLRNPFRFAFKPTTNEFYINDVGQNTWEEIDVGQLGADYGWNLREGPCATGSTTNCGPVPGMVNPIYAYPHSTGCEAITGGTFVPGGVWSGYEGAYLFSDFVCGKILGIFPDGVVREFASGLGGGSAVSLTFGPYDETQALYYTTYANGGQVHRILFTGQGNPPPPPPYTPSHAGKHHKKHHHHKGKRHHKHR